MVSADLSGFTAMSERLAARGREGSERLTSTVNSCFTVLIDAAAREGGDVVKFGGDALLLWFEGPDHRIRAARASARMQKSVAAARFARAGLRMSVGANSGEFDFFLVGREDWRELVVVGRAATATVDLEAAAGADQVLVSNDMAAGIPPDWCAGPMADGVALDLDAVPLPRRPVPEVRHVDTPELIAPTLRADIAALANTAGEHRLATIVFAELEGTDEALEQLGPVAFTDSVEELVRAAQGAAERFGVQFLYTDVIADGIKLICTAGAPTTSDDDEEAALRFAAELVPNDPKHKLRAGVNRGRVFAGFLGSPSRRTYTVMGDPVNLAARLMGKATPGQVVASVDTVAQSRALFETEALAPFLVKGKTEPIEAVVVGSPTGDTRTRRSADLPLIGRETELQLLRDAIGTAAAGMGQVVELVGDAGIGKTRLLAAVAADPRMLVRVACECQPYDTLTPYASIRTLVRRAFGIPVDATPPAAGEALAATVERVAPHLGPLLPLIAVPVGAHVASTLEADAVADDFRAERTHMAVVELMTCVLTAPTMLVVEDVYYVDDASLRLLQTVAAATPVNPWLLTVTRRPEGPGLVVGPVDGTLVKLQPLESEVVARLAEVAVGGRSVGALDLDLMARRSGGNPLFVLQLVDAAGEGVAADDLPESIERLVATRIDRLDPADRLLLRQAAVIGRVFHTSLLNTLRVTEGARPIEPDRWAHLGDLLEPEGERRWRFSHALYRDVAYEGLPFARRTRMHTAVGELLEAGVAGEPDLGLLSQHFWLGGDAERTWRYSVAAGDEAWSKSAIAEAIAAYRRALGIRRRLRRSLDPGDVARVAEALGDVLERAASYEDAERSYDLGRRVDPAADTTTEARLRRKLGTIAERTGRYPLALRRYRRAIAQLDEGSPAEAGEMARAELACGTVRHRQGFHHDLISWAQRARAHAALAGDRWVEAAADNAIQVGITHGAGDPGTDHGERALAAFRALDDELYVGKALNNLGIEAYYRGRWPEAASRYEGAHAAFSRAGDLAEAASALQNLGEIRCDQGRYTEAEAMLTQAHRDWSAAGFGIGVPLTEMNLGRTLARSGRRAEARLALERARESFDAMGAQSFARDVGTWIAEADLLDGRHRRALDVLDALADGGEAFPATEARTERIRGWALLQADRPDAARRALLEARDRCRVAELAFEELLVLKGLIALDPVATEASTWRLDAQRLRRTLGVEHLPQFPTFG